MHNQISDARDSGQTLLRRAGILVAWLSALLLISTGSAVAQEAHGHPARIHEGTCEALGPVAFRLNGVGGSVDVEGAPIATPTAVNVPAAHEVVLSETLIAAPLTDILSGEYAVMVYESDEEMTAITCGNVGGAMLDETLVTALQESGFPGHVGLALFHPEGEGTLVSLYLAHGLAELSAVESGGTEQAAGEADAHTHEEDEHGAAATPAA